MNISSLRDPRRLRAASVRFSSVLSGISKCLQFSLRAGAERVVSLVAGRCTAEADADVDADAAIGSASSSSERVTPHTDEHRC